MGLANCGCCFRLLFSLLNFGFLCLGISILSVGGLTRKGGPLGLGIKISSTIFNLLENSKSFNIGNPAEKIAQLLQYVSVPVIVLGAVMVTISLLGLIATCSGLKPLYIVYLILVSVILFAEILIIVLFYAGVFHKALEKFLGKQLKEKYTSTRSFAPINVVLNLIMIQFKCCGVSSYKDFQAADKWENATTVAGQTLILQVPIACCPTKFALDYMRTGKIKSADQVTCATNATSKTNEKLKKGCFKVVADKLSLLNKVVYVVLGITIAIQTVIVALGVLTCKTS